MKVVELSPLGLHWLLAGAGRVFVDGFFVRQGSRSFIGEVFARVQLLRFDDSPFA